jgi:hypothetical protein
MMTRLAFSVKKGGNTGRIPEPPFKFVQIVKER